MAKPSIFEDGEGEGAEADPLAGALDAFRPKEEGERRGPAPEQIDEITRGSKFRSREPRPAIDPRPPEGQPPAVSRPQPEGRQVAASWLPGGQPETVSQPSTKRLPMVYRTGRNTTFSVKTTPETVEAFYRIAQSRGWKAGETFERAIELLVAEVEGKGS